MLRSLARKSEISKEIAYELSSLATFLVPCRGLHSPSSRITWPLGSLLTPKSLFVLVPTCSQTSSRGEILFTKYLFLDGELFSRKGLVGDVNLQVLVPREHLHTHTHTHTHQRRGGIGEKEKRQIYKRTSHYVLLRSPIPPPTL